MLTVGKEAEGALFACCAECGGLAARVHGWESTPWAAGPVAGDDPRAPWVDDAPAEARRDRGAGEGGAEADVALARGGASLASQPTSIPDLVDRRLEEVLRDMGSTLDAATVRRHIALARSPSKVVEIVAGSAAVPDEEALEALCDALIDAWNHTPRSELGGRTPAQMSRAMAMPSDAARVSAPARVAKSVATDAPCLCGSGAPAGQCCAPQFH